MSDTERLAEMLGARHPCILIPTYEEALARQPEIGLPPLPMLDAPPAL